MPTVGVYVSVTVRENRGSLGFSLGFSPVDAASHESVVDLPRINSYRGRTAKPYDECEALDEAWFAPNLALSRCVKAQHEQFNH
jgi:hypothetical protein